MSSGATDLSSNHGLDQGNLRDVASKDELQQRSPSDQHLSVQLTSASTQSQPARSVRPPIRRFLDNNGPPSGNASDHVAQQRRKLTHADAPPDEPMAALLQRFHVQDISRAAIGSPGWAANFYHFGAEAIPLLHRLVC